MMTPMGSHRADRTPPRSPAATAAAVESGHGHSHGGPPPALDVGLRARAVLLGLLAVGAVVTLVGLVVLWPAASDAPEEVDFLRSGTTTLTAPVVDVGPSCPVLVDGEQGSREPPPEDCDTLTADVGGEDVTLGVPPYVGRSGLVAGDTVRLIRLPASSTPDGQVGYGFAGVERTLPLGLLAGAFVVLVGLVARLRGLLALVGLGLAALVIARFLLPALLAGGSGWAVAAVGSAAIMYVVLYLAHGPSLRTSAALLGTLAGIGATALLGVWAVGAARLSGISDETGEVLATYAPALDSQGVLACAVIIAGLGVLNDVTITQSSAVWELRAAAPELSRRQLFGSAMRIGRDHIASTIYTIVFAYAGTGLAVLMLLSLYDRPFLELLADESIAVEIVRTLASAVGLVLAVPLTTAVAALTVGGAVVPEDA